MIEADDNRGRNEHAPVAIEGENDERTENVKVRFDSAAGHADEQR